MRFEPLITLPSAWTVVAERFGVHLFEGELTVADMERMQIAGDTWHRRNPGRIVELVVVHPSEHRMTSDERAKMTEIIRRWETIRDASATVILAEGLMGSLHRSVLTGLMMMAPAPHPAKVFAKVPPAVTFLAPHVQKLVPRASLETLLASVDEVSRAFHGRPRV